MFQWLSILGLSVLLLLDVVRLARGRVDHRVWLLRCLVWLTAIVAIAMPDLVTRVATSIGIRRGADLVTYLLALAFAGSTFFWYSRYVKLQSEITQLVRYLAIREAERGGAGEESA